VPRRLVCARGDARDVYRRATGHAARQQPTAADAGARRATSRTCNKRTAIGDNSPSQRIKRIKRSAV